MGKLGLWMLLWICAGCGDNGGMAGADDWTDASKADPQVLRDVAIQTGGTYADLASPPWVKGPTFGELAEHGDHGLGELENFFGEVAIVDGEVFAVRADGRGEAVADGAISMFTTRVHFEADDTLELSDMTMEELRAAIDEVLPSVRGMYAVRVTGNYSTMVSRAFQGWDAAPFATSQERISTQAVFELSAVQGTMAGYRLPTVTANVNTAGHHYHFITDDRTAGGHVLDCDPNACGDAAMVTRVDEVTVEIDYLQELRVMKEDGSYDSYMPR